MTENWKQWEGQVIAGAFPLRQYLGGDGDRAVFLTEFGSPASSAAIQIASGMPESNDLLIERWGCAAKLSHPHLLRILSLGRATLAEVPLVYLVTEYADESLAQVIPVRPLSVEEARQMLEPALSALEYLHKQGFAHGHVKPGNIMAVGDCLKLSIAGVCRIGECSPLARDDYAPPEAVASPAGDVWSLGVTLVETLTQQVPARSAADPQIPAGLPPPFFAIARECLRADPKIRSTITGIAARLNPGRPVARRPSLKWSYALAAAAALVLAAVVIAPRLINRQEPVVATEAPAPQFAPPAQPVPKVPPSPPAAQRRPAPAQSEIIQRVVPAVPARALRTIQGRVRVGVRVRVDPAGNVTQAKLDSAGPSQYFAQFALDAGRRWKFAPLSGSSRSREWLLQFEFSRTGAKAVPVRKSS